MTRLLQRVRRRNDERGSITPFVVIVLIGILLLAGLVIDGGRQLNAHGRAIAYAEEAARAGAQEVDVADPKLGLDVPLALKAAQDYCDQAMAKDTQLVSCTPNQLPVKGEAGDFIAVQVDTVVQIKALLLGILGTHDLKASGTAVARPVSGITGPDKGKPNNLPPPVVETPGQGDGGDGGDGGNDGGDPPPSTAPTQGPSQTVSACTTEKPTPTKSGDPTDKPSDTASPPSPPPSQCVTNEP